MATPIYAQARRRSAARRCSRLIERLMTRCRNDNKNGGGGNRTRVRSPLLGTSVLRHPGHRLVVMDALRERVPSGDNALRLRLEEAFSLSQRAEHGSPHRRGNRPNPPERERASATQSAPTQHVLRKSPQEPLANRGTLARHRVSTIAE